MSEFDPNEPTALDAPTPRVRPVARKGLPRTGTDPRAIARLAAQTPAPPVPDAPVPDAPVAPPAAPAHSQPEPPARTSTPRVPRGMGLPVPRPALTAAEALEAARTQAPPSPPAPATAPPRAPPPTATAASPAPARSNPKRAPAGPRGISVAAPPRALSAAEALEAARAAEAGRTAPATPVPTERDLAGVTDEVRRALARAAEATTPHPLPADLPQDELLATVQGLVDGLLPDSDAWVVSVARADRRRDGGTWRAHRSRATIVSDLGGALAAAIVLQAVETRPRSVVYARVANTAGERLLVVDVDDGRPLAALPNPLDWGVPVE